MPAQTTNLFLLEDLEDVGRTSELAETDREALQAVAEWIKSSWSSLTRISVALGPSVPLCLGHWNARHFGWLRNRSPSGTGPKSSSS